MSKKENEEASEKTESRPTVPHISVESMMTAKVQKIVPTMTVRDAIKVLITYKISGAPVVDDFGKVLSVVSEGVLLKLAASQGLDKTINLCLKSLPRADQLITLKKTSTFAEAYSIFLARSVHRIIIVDGNGKLQGILSRSNILRVLSSPDETGQADGTEKADKSKIAEKGDKAAS